MWARIEISTPLPKNLPRREIRVTKITKIEADSQLFPILGSIENANTEFIMNRNATHGKITYRKSALKMAILDLFLGLDIAK